MHCLLCPVRWLETPRKQHRQHLGWAGCTHASHNIMSCINLLIFTVYIHLFMRVSPSPILKEPCHDCIVRAHLHVGTSCHMPGPNKVLPPCGPSCSFHFFSCLSAVPGTAGRRGSAGVPVTFRVASGGVDFDQTYLHLSTCRSRTCRGRWPRLPKFASEPLHWPPFVVTVQSFSSEPASQDVLQ